MKKLLSLFLAVVMVAAFLPATIPEAAALSATSGWTSGADGKYHITSAEDLLAFGQSSSDFSGATVVLDNDVVFNDKTAAQMAADSTNLNVWVQNTGTFRGTFDGQGHSIKGLYSTSQGLFSDIAYATVKDLRLLDSCVTNTYSTGLVGNTVYGSTFEGVYVNGYIRGPLQIAGFCYEVQYGTTIFNKCWFDGTVDSTTYSDADTFAGFVDFVRNHTGNVQFTDCLYTGTVNVYNTSYGAGFVCKQGAPNNNNASATITFTNCVSLGAVNRANGAARGWAFCAKTDWSGAGKVVNTSNCYCDVSKYSGDSGQPDGTTLVGGYTAVSSADYGDLASSLGDAWGYKASGSGFISVPLCFADYADKPVIATSGWVASSDGKWHITSAGDLLAFGQSSSTFEGATVVLDADVVFNDLSASYMKDNGATNTWVQNTGTFRGTFDGQGHYIKGLYASGQGLFNDVAYATIRNLRLLDSCVTNTYNKGLVANTVYGTTFDGIYVNGYIRGPLQIAGFCYEVQYGTTIFNKCWFDGTVDSTTYSDADTFAGFVDFVRNHTGNVQFTDCLYTGTVNVYNTSYGAGFVCKQGAPNNNNASATITFTNCVSLGAVNRANGAARGWAFCAKTDWSGAGKVVNTSNCYCDVSKYSGDSGQPDGSSLVGGYTAVTENDSSTLADALGSGWGYTAKNGKYIPVPLCFGEKLAGALIADVPGFDGKTVTGENKGLGEYTLVIDGTSLDDVSAYVDLLTGTHGFTLAYENTLFGDVYIAQLIKGDLLVTVNQIIKQNKTFVSEMFCQSLSPSLGNDVSAPAVSGAKNTLHQLKLTSSGDGATSGDSYVIQLKNSHFIIIDGGVSGELSSLVSYLESLTGGVKPVVEAWCITHQHADHSGLLYDFTSVPELKNRVFVEAFYINEPSYAVKDLDSGVYSSIPLERTAIASLSTASGGAPEIYRPMIGQSYSFCGVTMDVVFSQEMLALSEIAADSGESGNGRFNDVSTWFRFTLDYQTFLDGGDAYIAPMSFIMSTYDPEDIQVNYFSVLHHGAATWDDFTDWVGTFDNLLFPTSHLGEYNWSFYDSGYRFSAQNAHLRACASGDSYYAYLGTVCLEFTYEVSDYKADPSAPSTWVAPTQAGKKFAGWYLPDGSAFTGSSGSAIPRFVDEALMNVKAQERADGDTYRIRFVSTVDCLEYENVGFEISINGGAVKTSTSTKVYSSIIVDGVSRDAGYVSGCSDSSYITYCALKGIPNDVTGASISVKAFWTTSDGTRVYGAEKLYNLTTTASSITLTVA